MSYLNTFIKVSEDCPVLESEVPATKGDKKPAHLVQYELLTQQPYHYDHDDLVFEVFAIQKDVAEPEREEARRVLLSKGQPCLRASALVKRYGFGAHYNDAGKIALYPRESTAYQDFVNDPAVKKLNGMKTKR
ncbi:DUF6157 family protein [Rhabdobacter roseus]|uniref:Uncharacterized protein n=1 Tax=Rhabdobacter roseus TaxID=1655419 RepID=A0A840TYH2_9BACT|nr:DUF6157 family protein [Rhabdobacter roseus]MBB5286343.1 hypothetical protein [Rhabdobacter roseus]